MIRNLPLSCDASFSFSSSVDIAGEEHDQVNTSQFVAGIWNSSRIHRIEVPEA